MKPVWVTLPTSGNCSCRGPNVRAVAISLTIVYIESEPYLSGPAQCNKKCSSELIIEIFGRHCESCFNLWNHTNKEERRTAIKLTLLTALKNILQNPRGDYVYRHTLWYRLVPFAERNEWSRWKADVPRRRGHVARWSGFLRRLDVCPGTSHLPTTAHANTPHHPHSQYGDSVRQNSVD